MSKFCTNCGSPLPENTRFCGNCGSPVLDQPAPAEPAIAMPVYAGPDYYRQDAPTVEPVQPTAQTYQPVEPVQPPAQTYQPVQPGYQPTMPVAPQPPKKSNKGLIIAVCVIAFVLVAAVAVTLIVFGDRIFGAKKGGSDPSSTDATETVPDQDNSASTAKDALSKMIEATTQLDFKSLLDYSYEANFSKQVTDKDRDDLISQMEKELAGDDAKQFIDLYKTMMKNTKIDITGDETLSDSDLKQLKEDLSADYTDTDKITEAHTLTYNMKLSLLGETEDVEMEAKAIKVDGKWYIMEMSGDSMGALGGFGSGLGGFDDLDYDLDLDDLELATEAPAQPA